MRKSMGACMNLTEIRKSIMSESDFPFRLGQLILSEYNQIWVHMYEFDADL